MVYQRNHQYANSSLDTSRKLNAFLIISVSFLPSTVLFQSTYRRKSKSSRYILITSIPYRESFNRWQKNTFRSIVYLRFSLNNNVHFRSIAAPLLISKNVSIIQLIESRHNYAMSLKISHKNYIAMRWQLSRSDCHGFRMHIRKQ